MAQGESPHNPLAFASGLCPGRCLASQPTGSGGERAVDSHNHGPWPMILAVLCRSAAVSSTSFSAFATLPPSFPVILFLPLRLRFPVCGVYSAAASVVATAVVAITAASTAAASTSKATPAAASSRLVITGG